MSYYKKMGEVLNEKKHCIYTRGNIFLLHNEKTGYRKYNDSRRFLIKRGDIIYRKG